MIPVTCMVQEGQIDPATADQLKSGLAELSRSSFGAEPQFMWVEVGKGNGFTEAKPSTSSLVIFSSDRALKQDERIPILQEICDIWMDGTGCSINEIVATVSDPTG